MTDSKKLEEARPKGRDELPEIGEIKDKDLADKLVEAWAKAITEFGYGAISELPGEGNPNHLVLKSGTQVDHPRGVTRLAIQLVDEPARIKPGFRCNRDVVVAGGLLHDVGKPFEFDPKNRAKW